jgi:fluoride exporter
VTTLLCVAVGGAIGASARYLTGIGVGRLLGLDGFPFATLIVNVSGCFIMGLLIEAMALRWSVSNDLRAFLTVGILGGFTTFSAFSADFMLLMDRNNQLGALTYVAASVVLSLAAVYFGAALVRML